MVINVNEIIIKNNPLENTDVILFDIQSTGPNPKKDQILEIVSVIAAFGFLNRWNDTLGTVMEDEPKNFVTNELVPKGWDKF